MRPFALLVSTLALSFFGCGGEGSADDADEGALSRTGLERTLSFEGVVYAKPDATETEIVRLAQLQTKTAFGALRTSGMMAQTRELRNVQPATFQKRNVLVVDPQHPEAAGEAKVEVRYTYKDEVLVEEKLGERTSFGLAVLRPDWETEYQEPTRDCVANDREARADARDGYLWYVFDPTLATCKRAIADEKRVIEADRATLSRAAQAAGIARAAPAAAGEAVRIARSQANRRYIPINVALENKRAQRGAVYPEYDRLFRGGIEANKLVVGFLVGRLEHHWVDASKDGNYWEWMSALDTLFEAHPEFSLTKVEPADDITKVTTTAGKTYTNLSIRDYINFAIYDRFPDGTSDAQKRALALAAGRKLDQKWLTFEKKVKVAIGDEAPRDFTIELRTYFGVEEQKEPYQRALKNSDVFVYNGHSFLGAGPLDPRNYQASDFPSSYQLWFIDGCISYNYYNEGYFPLKGGSQNLDLIVNGMEADADYGGMAEAKLISRLISGKQPSYKQLLEAAKQTDPLRIVEGEADNKYRPTETKITVAPR
ncbi:MAG: hypothetical protein IPG50_10325 [Myxococcales bacterium]|nr:hypothetical protein [Myxococcales bacterium]